MSIAIAKATRNSFCPKIKSPSCVSECIEWLEIHRPPEQTARLYEYAREMNNALVENETFLRNIRTGTFI